MVVKTGCEACNKASLSLLLLRPSPIAKTKPVEPLAVSHIAAEPASVAGLLPTRLPTESRFVLRLLRAGYVHIHIPNPPAGVREWMVYRVTEEADLVPQGHAMFAQPGQKVGCVRDVHIPTGMKVLSIPQAHKIAEIWVAYSANLWNDTLRSRNKANPAVMQKVSLKDGGPNTFKPTAEKLKAQVLEFGISKIVIDNSVEQDFPFTKLANQVDDMVAGLQRAAARHPKTAGKELAVVLRDPVGIAAELNALRLRRNEPIKREFEKKEVVHPLNSSNALLGLQQAVVDESALASYDEVCPLVTEEEWERKRAKWPPGTERSEVTPAERAQLLSGKGRSLTPLRRQQLEGKERVYWVVFPNLEQRAAKWTKREAAKNWERFKRFYDEQARANWVKNFEERMTREHYLPLEKMEKDWLAAVEDKHTLAYLEHHFDTGPGPKGKPAVDSAICAIESQLATVPGPLTTGSVTDRYIAILGLPVTHPGAKAIRAAFGNKESIIEAVGVQLSGDPGSDGMRDKTFDLIKGFTELMGTESATGKWVGQTLALFSINLIGALAGAAFTVAARGGSWMHDTGRFENIQKLLVVQRALEIAVEGAVKGNAPKLPVLLTMKVSAQEALAIRQARPGAVDGVSKKRLERYQRNGRMVTLTLLTDTDAIKAAGGDLATLARQDAAVTVHARTGSVDKVVNQHHGKTTVLSQAAFTALYQRQMGMAAKSANLVRNILADAGPASSSLSLGALSKTLDARLAIGSMIIQAIGIWHGANSLKKAGDKNDDNARTEATYGVADSLVGFAGGALQLAALVQHMRLNVQTLPFANPTVAESVINKNIPLAGLRILGGLTGVAGGIINFVASLKKAEGQGEKGNDYVAKLYGFSAYAFIGTGATAFVLTSGTIAQVLAARGIGGVAVQQIANRLAGNIAIRVGLGLTVSVTGIGVVLLGAGIALQIGAIVLTPDELQRWIGRSYFGTDGGLIIKGKRSDRFTKWEYEQSALKELLAKADKDAGEEQKAESAGAL